MRRDLWRKSTRSGNNGQCVEVRDRGAQIDVRDSNFPAAAVLSFDPVAWATFTDSLKVDGIRA
ncbi:DUF397 domain-containing protein [Micromonospora oryzae]|uniref:DUF397 domain-containing protein n=1 Tax=Micromonospora sp. DSM 102119 TaxID=3111768 RepID=UPI0031DE42D2